MEMSETRSALVTGASVGIGRMLAVALARQRYRVILVARSKDALAETVRLVEGVGGCGISRPVDLRDIDATVRLADSVVREFGALDLIANVAGVWHDEESAFQGPLLHETPTQQILDVLDVGIRAPMILTGKLLPPMVERKQGYVLNVSGTFYDGAKGWLDYYVSKKALEDFTVGLAEELRDSEIQVNCICPAEVATDPYVRLYPACAASALNPDEVVELATTMIGESFRHVTGQIIELRNRKDHK
jgi:NAD(P)-dependent dehydrogenase (short-subunit alcohol dehydrogenase family)